MKKILVTGANGFIGRHVIRRLGRENVEIIATSLEPSILPELQSPGLVYKTLDIGDPSVDVVNILGRPDVLIHLAWPGLDNFKDERHYLEYMPASYAFLKKMIQAGVNNINIIGTCLEYGMREGCLKESFLPEPVTSYGRGKDKLRRELEELLESHPFLLKWIRLFYLYGEGQSSRTLLSQLDRAIKNKNSAFKMSGGEQLRDYLPVEDVANYIVRIALQEEITGIINCCSGKPVKIRDFVESYLKRHDYQIKLELGFYPYPDYEPMAFWGDRRRLNLILGNS